MKVCPYCGAQCADEAAFCVTCGHNFNQAPVANVAPSYAPSGDPADHTAEFDPKDISDNKVMVMFMYLSGVLGIVIGMLANNDSPFFQFHLRQAMKLQVTTMLLGIVTALLFWTIIVPVAAGICMLILVVIEIIAFFWAASGKAKELPIINNLGFLK